MRKLFLLVFAVAFFYPLSAHAFCYGVTTPVAPIYPDGNVCGTLQRFGYDGTNFLYRPAGQSYVKICPAGQQWGCSTTTTGTYTDAWGRPVQAWTFYRFAYGWDEGYWRYYDLYAWATSPTDYWGSPDVPVLKNVYVSRYGNEGIGITMPPRPLDPTPVYPSGSNVPNTYLVRWESGRDTTDRKPYPITYAIWYKYWPFGGTEPAEFTLARDNMPCHDDGSNTPDQYNECTTYIVGPQPAGNWKWYVVATLDASRYYYVGTTLKTQSGEKFFTQPNP